jgi:hypothetical protein
MISLKLIRKIFIIGPYFFMLVFITFLIVQPITKIWWHYDTLERFILGIPYMFFYAKVLRLLDIVFSFSKRHIINPVKIKKIVTNRFLNLLGIHFAFCEIESTTLSYCICRFLISKSLNPIGKRYILIKPIFVNQYFVLNRVSIIKMISEVVLSLMIIVMIVQFFKTH